MFFFFDDENNNSFEEICHIDENGKGFQYARELQEILGYAEWSNSHKVIQKAMISCKTVEFQSRIVFADVGKPIVSGKGKDGYSQIDPGRPRCRKMQIGLPILPTSARRL